MELIRLLCVNYWKHKIYSVPNSILIHKKKFITSVNTQFEIICFAIDFKHK